MAEVFPLLGVQKVHNRFFLIFIQKIFNNKNPFFLVLLVIMGCWLKTIMISLSAVHLIHFQLSWKKEHISRLSWEINKNLLSKIVYFLMVYFLEIFEVFINLEVLNRISLSQIITQFGSILDFVKPNKSMRKGWIKIQFEILANFQF